MAVLSKFWQNWPGFFKKSLSQGNKNTGGHFRLRLKRRNNQIKQCMSLDGVMVQKQLDILGVDQISADVTELFLIILNVMILWLHKKMSLFLEMFDEVLRKKVITMPIIYFVMSNKKQVKQTWHNVNLTITKPNFSVHLKILHNKNKGKNFIVSLSTQISCQLSGHFPNIYAQIIQGYLNTKDV